MSVPGWGLLMLEDKKGVFLVLLLLHRHVLTAAGLRGQGLPQWSRGKYFLCSHAPHQLCEKSETASFYCGNQGFGSARKFIWVTEVLSCKHHPLAETGGDRPRGGLGGKPNQNLRFHAKLIWLGRQSCNLLERERDNWISGYILLLFPPLYQIFARPLLKHLMDNLLPPTRGSSGSDCVTYFLLATTGVKK